MGNSRAFDREEFVKGATNVGIALPIAEALADDYAYLYALRCGETADAGPFDKDRCVKRLTEAGCSLRVAEFFADEWAHIAALLRGQKHAPSPASAD